MYVCISQCVTEAVAPVIVKVDAYTIIHRLYTNKNIARIFITVIINSYYPPFFPKPIHRSIASRFSTNSKKTELFKTAEYKYEKFLTNCRINTYREYTKQIGDKRTQTEAERSFG